MPESKRLSAKTVVNFQDRALFVKGYLKNERKLSYDAKVEMYDIARDTWVKIEYDNDESYDVMCPCGDWVYAI